MAAAQDLDDDGDLDLVVINADGTLRSLINDGGSENQWIEIVPRAVADDPQFRSNRVNMQGIGSTIELRSGFQYQAHIVDAPKLHFGLGQAKVLDSIRTIWTDGIPQHVAKTELLRSRLGILAPQILTGSCPYIYTWNGERFEFFSDCLWAAPIGLVQATGDMAPTREWEYLLIPGDKLKPKDDRYVIQLTEELWEAAYFDEVKLVAVDHPADVSIFTNEKVGSPQMAAHRIHTVKNARQFKSITTVEAMIFCPACVLRIRITFRRSKAESSRDWSTNGRWNSIRVRCPTTAKCRKTSDCSDRLGLPNEHVAESCDRAESIAGSSRSAVTRSTETQMATGPWPVRSSDSPVARPRRWSWICQACCRRPHRSSAFVPAWNFTGISVLHRERRRCADSIVRMCGGEC